MLVLLIFLISFLISILFIKLLINKYAEFLLDTPNIRSSHVYPKITAGGISFVVIGSFGFIFFQEYQYLLCLILALVGFLDDKFNIFSPIRYLFQFLTAYLILNLSNLNTIIDQNFTDYQSLFFKLFVLVFITAIINFINFMDGIDGLIGGSLSLILTYLILRGNIYLLPLLASLLGFLIFNWHPSKIFMGDTGSTFLGSVLSFELCNSNSSVEFINLFIITSPILIDAFTCVFRRWCFGQNIFTAHKLHIYQRLQQSGLSHAKVTTIYLSLILVIILSLIFRNYLITTFILSNCFFVLFYLDQKVAIKFKDALYLNK